MFRANTFLLPYLPLFLSLSVSFSVLIHFFLPLLLPFLSFLLFFSVLCLDIFSFFLYLLSFLTLPFLLLLHVSCLHTSSFSFLSLSTSFPVYRVYTFLPSPFPPSLSPSLSSFSSSMPFHYIFLPPRISPLLVLLAFLSLSFSVYCCECNQPSGAPAFT